MQISRIFKLLAQSLMVVMILAVAYQPTEARSVSKKFMKGFILGAYMAKHHKPVIVVTKKHGWVSTS